jgi:zinc protease
MPAMDLLSSVYFSESSPLYQKLVLEEQSVDQLMTYFPNRKDPNLLMIYARLTDEKHAADVEAAINDTLAQARTALIEAQRLEGTKSRLRYLFTAELDSAGGIGSVLASFVHFARTPETINEVYRSYDALTPQDIRDAAGRYFVDAGRVTVTLSSGGNMAGIDGSSSVDELVAAARESAPDMSSSVGETNGGPGNTTSKQPATSPAAVNVATETPVTIVAQPGASAPLVDVAFIVHAGAAMDPPRKKGLASLTAAMITEGGSASHTIQQINDAMYPIASGFDAQVDKEMTRLSGQVHKDNLDTWYGLVSGQLLHPGWREQDFRRVKTQLVNSIRTSLVANNDEELGKEILYSEIYGPGHPYGSLTLGHIADIEAITLADVKRFYEAYYTVSNLTVGLAGGYGADFPARVASDLQVLPAGTRVRAEIPPALPPEANEAAIIEKETPAVAVSLGIPIDLRRGDPDWIALWLARSYLGEHRSTNAHLFQRIREERGMNYGDYAYIEYFPRGMFQFHPDTNLARQQQIFQIWIRPVRNNNDAHFAIRTAVFELQKLIDEGMSEADFEATRSFLSKFASLLTDGQSRQLGYEIDSQYYGTGRFADYVREGLSRLTLEDVNRVIRENLVADKMQYVFVTKDAADLRQRLIDDSPISYDSAKPPELLEEDRKIASLPLVFEERAVRVVPATVVFGGSGT